MDVNYVSRDTYGMYKNSQKGPVGSPGTELEFAL